MKAINSKFQEGFDAFYKNPSWKKLYDAAPSDAAKEHLESTWAYSHWINENKREMPDDMKAAHEKARDEIQSRMTKADFEFLASTAPHPKCREWFLKKAEQAGK